MTLESENLLLKNGWIEVICGCMFSGKTEELIRRVNRAKIAKQTVKIFKPIFETRYHPENVVSHNAQHLEAIAVTYARQIIELSENAHVVAIDEAQFFDDEIIEVCNFLANQGKRVIVVGLDMDYRGKPFGPMPQLLAIAEFVTKLHAICAVSGELASFSYRKIQHSHNVLLGSQDIYEPRSRKFFFNASA